MQDQDTKIEGGVESINWKEGLISIGKAIRTLELIKYIVQRSRKITNGKVIIHISNKILLREIYKPINKESNVTGEVSATVGAI